MLAKQGTRQHAVYIRAIQQIQQLNCMLNPQNSNPVSDTGSNSTKNNIFNSTDTHVENIAPVTTEISSRQQSVELEAQSLTPQTITDSTSNSTESNKARSVKSKPLKVGDLVVIKAGGLSGKTGTIEQLTPVNLGKQKSFNAVVSSPSFGMPQTIPVNHLELVK